VRLNHPLLFLLSFFFFFCLFVIVDLVAECSQLQETKKRGEGGGTAAKKAEERLVFLGAEIAKLNRRISELQEEVMTRGTANGKEIHDQIMYHIRLLSPIEARKILQLMADDTIQLKLDVRKKDAHVKFWLFFSFFLLPLQVFWRKKKLTHM
jgi:cell division protein FtsB